jgi:hypothetical protein
MPFADQKLAKDWRNYPPEIKAQLLAQINEQLARTVGAAFKRKYRNDRVAFIHDCIDWREGEQPAKYQDDIFGALDEHRRVAVRGPHGIGKTAIAALAVLHFALTRDGEDWKCPTTASAWRQLSKFLWPEIHKWSRRLQWEKVLRQPLTQNELQTLNLKLTTGEAFAVASSNFELIEGAHADELLYVFDEAKAISNGIFDAAEGAFSGGESTEAFALAISTPGEPSGRFYDIHARKPGLEEWWTRHVTLDEAIDAGRISKAWADEKKRLWGESSAVYANRVLGDFHAADEDGLIPLAWIEAANDRWLNWSEQDDSRRWLPFTCVGVDIARSMDGDKTVLALRHEDAITELRRYSEADTMSVVGHVAGVLNARGGFAVVDVIGVGGGPVDRLREQNFTVRAFNSSSAAPSAMTDRSGELGFLNTRSAAWWTLRERLDPAYGPTIAFPPDDLLTGDLTAPHWRVSSGGKIQVEGKDDGWTDSKGNKRPSLRQRLGRSTDDGDAVVMAFFEEPTVKDRYTEEDVQSYSQQTYW